MKPPPKPPVNGNVRTGLRNDAGRNGLGAAEGIGGRKPPPNDPTPAEAPIGFCAGESPEQRTSRSPTSKQRMVRPLSGDAQFSLKSNLAMLSRPSGSAANLR